MALSQLLCLVSWSNNDKDSVTYKQGFQLKRNWNKYYSYELKLPRHQKSKMKSFFLFCFGCHPGWTYSSCEMEALNSCSENMTFKSRTFLPQLMFGCSHGTFRPCHVNIKTALLTSVEGQTRNVSSPLLSLPLIKFPINFSSRTGWGFSRYEVCVGFWHLCLPISGERCDPSVRLPVGIMSEQM